VEENNPNQSEGKMAKKLSKMKLAKIDDEEHFPHLDYPHLKPENIKDANGRRPTDPNYDPKTLHIPSDFLKSQTPGIPFTIHFIKIYYFQPINNGGK
jgi:hypothetical protein